MHRKFFIFILTDGILLSQWCLEELKSAMDNKKKVIILRDLAYSLPAVLPTEWQEVESLLRTPDQLVWMAEYNTPCIIELLKKMGPSELACAGAKKLLETNPDMLKMVQETGVLQVKQANDFELLTIKEILPALKLELQNRKITVKKIVASANLFQAHHFSVFEDVEEVDLDGESNLESMTDHSLVFFSDGCPNLKSLNLTNSTKITDIGIKLLAEGCHKLETLILNKCGISDLAVESISMNCHNLRSISLNECMQVTNTAISSLQQGCPKLKYLSVDGCSMMTNTALKRAAKMSCLEHLNVANCEEISDKGIKELAEGCKSLLVLNIAGCKVTDAALKGFSERTTLIRK